MEPFQVAFTVVLNAGIANGGDFKTVPLGKRAVIEHVSVFAEPPAALPAQYFITSTIGGTSAFREVPIVTAPTGTGAVVGSHPIRAYADPQTEFGAVIRRFDTSHPRGFIRLGRILRSGLGARIRNAAAPTPLFGRCLNSSAELLLSLSVVILDQYIPKGNGSELIAMPARHFPRPFNWWMLQTSFDHLTLQLIGVLLNGWVHHEFMIPRSIGFDLLPNGFVIANEPFVGHIFNAHKSNSSHPVIAGGYPASGVR
jgi:hypothetical protein